MQASPACKATWLVVMSLFSVGLLPVLSEEASAESKSLVIVSTGGSYAQALKKHFYDPFEQDTGIVVTSVSAAGGEQWAKTKAMSEAGNLAWDMVLTSSDDIYNPQKQKLLHDLGPNCESVPKAKTDGFEDTCNRYGILLGYGATLLVNHKGVLKERTPQNWPDFWNVKEFPGPRALPDYDTPWRVLIGALLADGVPPGKLFPLNLERAFRKLDEIAPHVGLWWKTGDQIQRAYRNGEVASGLTWSTRTETLIREGVPLERVWDGATLNLSRWSIIKGGPNTENAIRFLKWWLDHPENQVAFGREVAVSPATKSATGLLSPADRDASPASELNRRKIIDVDYAWLGDNSERMLKAWKDWISKAPR